MVEKGNENNVMQPPTLMFNLGGVNFEEFCDFIEQHPEELPYDVLDNIAQGYNADFFRKTKSFIFLGMHHLLEELRKKGECPVDRETVIFIRQPMPGQVAVNTIRLLNFDGSNLHDLSNGEMEAHLQIPKLMKMFRENVPGFENCYLDSINASIGVRESRRIKGIKMLDHHESRVSRCWIITMQWLGKSRRTVLHYVDTLLIFIMVQVPERIVLPLKSLLESPMDAWCLRIFPT